MDQNLADISAPSKTVSNPASSRPASSSFVPQGLLDAADAKIATWSTAVIDAADTVERLASADSLPLPDSVRDLVTSTSQKLRNFGSAASEREAADLVTDLQRTAAAHPAASIGIGAVVGAALATLLVRLRTPAIDARAAASPSASRGPAGATASRR
ncbi:hypothetical protein HL653_22780 [Sphingomonas sp. AP4-R1]|uniref:hypothetical protein n=1 Tax=Sphingomonas sp. AP4-R1 TaxID=2735134 RepID=UPI00149398B7|nr:hypothetical protein [Sphingomonas sp. AP4-R1]QJU60186.1 hypothetical protein HL653_22780 [Sphingomonas sp. AP4-R1]